MQFGVSSGKAQGLRGGEQVGGGLQADEEQARKFDEIISLLLAGGYFRARIATLDPFDKVRCCFRFLSAFAVFFFFVLKKYNIILLVVA
jgi:hypothetical protein